MDKKTAEQLYETCYMKVYSYVMTLAKDKHAAEEITQETFFKAMTTQHTFRGESESYSWLCAIAKNAFIDSTRKQSRLQEEPDEPQADIGTDIEQSITDQDTSFRIHLLLHSMEEPYREVFELRVFGELSFTQIGAIFGKTETWARVTYHRARLKLKERMDKNEI
ncbi:RNA polymerase sigma factor [Ruminococcus sp. XPD3002]|uniref:RNA polymerase sigma factor n=1 Tax=Ruminococcus sp. XPD3002 TaxID=1452269 RepID=UPI00091B7B25|nr:RNA polymerase sigma-70 factor, ECF subfamily [Ruminococcus flavefaciens]HPY84822.1 RNA polymerase sigma factor [Ruminococcus flavefaciens]HRU96053.1 RNA polymerase sigma factor [Ruminococcus sp.]